MSFKSEALKWGVKALKPWVMKAGGKGIKGIAPIRSLAKAGAVLSGLSTIGNAIPGVKNLVPDTFSLQNLNNQSAEGPTLTFPTAGAAGAGIENDPYYQALAKLAQGGGAGGGGGGGAAPNYGAMSNMANQAGGASVAAMQRLAEQATGAATGIRGGGEASAAALQRIYGDAANQIMEASKTKGAAGSSLTPVSGMLAALPDQVKQAGGTMSDYLKANQLVAAQDAGFLGELAAMQAPGYATQFARQDAVFRMADQARRAAAARAAAAGRGDAATQALLTMAKLKSEYMQNNPAPSVTTDITSLVKAWDDADANQKAYWKSMGINTAQDYINAAAKANAAQVAKLG